MVTIFIPHSSEINRGVGIGETGEARASLEIRGCLKSNRQEKKTSVFFFGGASPEIILFLRPWPLQYLAGNNMVDGLPVILFQISKRVLWLRDITIFSLFLTSSTKFIYGCDCGINLPARLSSSSIECLIAMQI